MSGLKPVEKDEDNDTAMRKWTICYKEDGEWDVFASNTFDTFKKARDFKKEHVPDGDDAYDERQVIKINFSL